MLKENRKLIDCWTFNWFNPRMGQQLIRMKLYECSGFFVSHKYAIEMENNYGFIFYANGCVNKISDTLLIGYFFDIYMATVIDNCIRGAEGYYNFDQINEREMQIMKSFHWYERNESYPNNPQLRYPNGNGWNFNPHTKDYFAFFRGNSIFERESWDIIKTLNVPEWNKPESYSVNLKISNKAASLETVTGMKIYEFSNSDHILFLALHSIKYSSNGELLLEEYYKR